MLEVYLHNRIFLCLHHSFSLITVQRLDVDSVLYSYEVGLVDVNRGSTNKFEALVFVHLTPAYKMGEDEERHRVVVLGAGAVGKTSILSRFLYSKFSVNYKPTVDDLHCKDYNVCGAVIKVDFLDTSGDLAFPAMRRLSISTAHAFILVYAVDNPLSFQEVTRIWDQIMEERDNYQDVPCVFVGNKADLCHKRQLTLEDCQGWARSQGRESFLLEISAKEDDGVVNIFQKLLEQANIPKVRQLEPILSRRLSAKEGRTNKRPQIDKLKDSESKLGRSRSLIRRASRPKVKESSDMNSNDCVIC